MKTSGENDWAEETAAAIVDVIKNNVGEPGFKWFDQEQAIAAALDAQRDEAIEECAKVLEDVNDPESAEFLRDALKSAGGSKGEGKA